MDPNENLRKQRELQNWIDHYTEPLNGDDTEYVEKLVELALLAESMDDWLHRGGALPDAWKNR